MSHPFHRSLVNELIITALLYTFGFAVLMALMVYSISLAK
jgi:hypothetical protein